MGRRIRGLGAEEGRFRLSRNAHGGSGWHSHPVAVRKNIHAFVGSRATFSSLLTTLEELHRSSDLTVVAAGPITAGYGSVKSLHNRRFTVIVLPDGNDLPPAAATAAVMSALARLWSTSQPDAVLVHGDRFETLAAASAAALMNIPLAHTQGGEVTGSVDEQVRHAVSKLAHMHLCATPHAARRLRSLGEPPERIRVVGQLRLDLAGRTARLLGSDPETQRLSALASTDLSKPFALVMHHPVATAPYGAGREATAVVAGATSAGLPVLAVPPNLDLGSASVYAVLDAAEAAGDLVVLPSMEPEDAVGVLARAAFVVGNSSVTTEECAALRVPAVCVGSRQNGRDVKAPSVRSDATTEAVTAAVAQVTSVERRRPFGVPDGAGTQAALGVLALAGGAVPIQKRFDNNVLLCRNLWPQSKFSFSG